MANVNVTTIVDGLKRHSASHEVAVDAACMVLAYIHGYFKPDSALMRDLEAFINTYYEIDDDLGLVSRI